MAEIKQLSIKGELRKCINLLSTVKGSPDQLEEVLIPVRRVMDTLSAMCNAIWEPGDPEDKMPEEMKEKIKMDQAKEEVISDEHIEASGRNGLQMGAGK